MTSLALVKLTKDQLETLINALRIKVGLIVAAYPEELEDLYNLHVILETASSELDH